MDDQAALGACDAQQREGDMRRRAAAWEDTHDACILDVYDPSSCDVVDVQHVRVLPPAPLLAVSSVVFRLLASPLIPYPLHPSCHLLVPGWAWAATNNVVDGGGGGGGVSSFFAPLVMPLLLPPLLPLPLPMPSLMMPWRLRVLEVCPKT